MHYAALMRLGKARKDVRDDSERFMQGEPFHPAQALAQTLTLDQLHDNELIRWDDDPVIHADDVGVCEGSGMLRFQAESRHNYLIVGEVLVNELDRDLPA
jgi:hypothetical protein